jgi:hypothetical protein
MIAWNWTPTAAPDHIQQQRMVQLCELLDDSHRLVEYWYDPADHSHYNRVEDKWYWNDTSKETK